MLCLLGDRDLTARGVDVDFFGDATRFPAGPAALALRTGAALLPVTLSFTGRTAGTCALTTRSARRVLATTRVRSRR